jgi:hypothetical protein
MDDTDQQPSMFDIGVPLIAYFPAYSSFGYVTAYTALFIYLGINTRRFIASDVLARLGPSHGFWHTFSSNLSIMQIGMEKTMGDANLAPKIQKAPCGIKKPTECDRTI